jgi:hypothetical protein
MVDFTTITSVITKENNKVGLGGSSHAKKVG